MSPAVKKTHGLWNVLNNAWSGNFFSLAPIFVWASLCTRDFVRHNLGSMVVCCKLIVCLQPPYSRIYLCSGTPKSQLRQLCTHFQCYHITDIVLPHVLCCVGFITPFGFFMWPTIIGCQFWEVWGVLYFTNNIPPPPFSDSASDDKLLTASSSACILPKPKH